MTSKRAEEAARWLSDQGAAMEQALASLVDINSHTDNIVGGRKVGAALRELFAIPGLTGHTLASPRYADHLLFEAPGGGSAPVALLGHLDTVFPPGTFEGYRREGDIARGPGVLDMKGGLCVVAFALKALAASGKLPALRVVVVSDEEVGSPEGQKVIREAIAGARAALVFEAGRAKDAIITRRKGTGAVTVTARGVAAHAGNAHREGKNAIWALSRFVDGVQKLTDYDRGVTVNVGKIRGGQGKNTVPALAEAWLDFRFCTDKDGKAVVDSLKRVAKEAADSVPGTSLVLEGGIARLPLERTAESAALSAAYAACARASGLGDGEADLVGGGSDASTSHAMGIPSIDGLGPRGTGFHTKEELIEIGTLVPKAQALARFLATNEA